MIQTVLVIALVGLAIGYLGWQFYTRFFSKKEKCDGCAIGKTREV